MVSDIKCPDKMDYKDCGTQYQATCLNQKGFEGGPCQEGCFCRPGYVSNGDECVRPRDCGCIWDGVLYKVAHHAIDKHVNCSLHKMRCCQIIFSYVLGWR